MRRRSSRWRASPAPLRQLQRLLQPEDNTAHGISGVQLPRRTARREPRRRLRRQAGLLDRVPGRMARGAAFDLDLEYRIGQAIGDEMLASGNTMLLAPTMNILRHPAWGRAQETYGEDSVPARPPRHGVHRRRAEVRRRQRQALRRATTSRTAAQTANARWTSRRCARSTGATSRWWSQDGGVASSWRRTTRSTAKGDAERHLLTDILRDDFGFQGFVLSDWWAMPRHQRRRATQPLKPTAVEAVHAGLDIELPWALNYGSSRIAVIRRLADGRRHHDVGRAHPGTEVPLQGRQAPASRLRARAPTTTLNASITTTIRSTRDRPTTSRSPRRRRASRWCCSRTTNNTLPISATSVTKIAVIGAT